MYDPEKFDFDNIDEINIDDINVDDIDIEEIDSFDFEDLDIDTNENHSFYNKDRQNTIHTYKETDYLEDEENEDTEEIDVSNVGYNKNLDELFNEYKSMDNPLQEVIQESLQHENEPQQEVNQELVNSSNNFQQETRTIRRAIGRRNEQDNIQQVKPNIRADYGTIPELEGESQQVDEKIAYNIETNIVTENINSIHKLESENIENNNQDYNIDFRNINKNQENIRSEEEKREKKPEDILSEKLNIKDEEEKNKKLDDKSSDKKEKRVKKKSKVKGLLVAAIIIIGIGAGVVFAIKSEIIDLSLIKDKVKLSFNDDKKSENKNNPSPKKVAYTKGKVKGNIYENSWSGMQLDIPEGFKETTDEFYNTFNTETTECGLYLMDEKGDSIVNIFSDLTDTDVGNANNDIDIVKNFLYNKCQILADSKGYNKFQKIKETTMTIAGKEHYVIYYNVVANGLNIVQSYYAYKIEDKVEIIIISCVGGKEEVNDKLVSLYKEK